MLGAILALVVVAGLPPSPDPSSLVGELGSPRYRQRESAEAALSSLGRAAMPALRAAREAKDPEVRLRASAILSRIEGALLVEATPIALDFLDAPLGDALRTINARSGLALRLAPEDDPAWRSARLTLRADEPLPFWKGLDALCAAARLHYAFGGPTPPGQKDSIFPLYEGYAPPPGPVSDSGPFRTLLASVHYQSEILLSPPRAPLPPREGRPTAADDSGRPASVASRQFYLQLMVAAEPRLSVTQNGAPRVVEAVDDRGQSLLIAADQATIQHSSGYFGMNPSPVIRFRVDLAYPEAPGRRIRSLRGAMPVIVATRKPDPLSVALASAAGKTFRTADVALTVREIRPGRDGQATTIELTLKPLGGAVAPATATGAEVDPLAARFESPQQQLEVLDAAGNALPWFPSASFYDGDETRLSLSLLSREGAVLPATIAYHGIVRTPAEVPFAFRDVPIP